MRSIFRAGSWAVIPLFSYPYASSHCNEETPKSPSDPCSKYNTWLQRVSWADRPHRCTTEVGCEFRGWSSLGTCQQTTHQREAHDIAPSPAPSTAKPSEPHPSDHEAHHDHPKVHWKFAKVNKGKKSGVAGDKSESSERSSGSIQILVDRAIAPTAVDSIKESEELVNELAKTICIDVLQKKEYATVFGVFLQDLFKFDSVREPTVGLVTWAVATPEAFQNTLHLAKVNRDYWIGVDQEGRPYTDVALRDLSTWWFDHPLTKTDVVLPLITWSLEQREMALDPAVDNIKAFVKSKSTQVLSFADFIHHCIIVLISPCLLLC